MNHAAAVTDLSDAQKLLQAAIETCDELRKRFGGTDAAAITRLKNGLRIALDRVGDALDDLERKGLST